MDPLIVSNLTSQINPWWTLLFDYLNIYITIIGWIDPLIGRTVKRFNEFL